MRKPFLPNEIPGDGLKLWRRGIVAKVFAHAQDGGATIDSAARGLWGDEVAERVTRAAVSPLSTASAAMFGANVLGAYLGSLRTRSAAARLFELAPRADLTGVATVSFPMMPSGFPAPAFVIEGGPIPVQMGSFALSTLGPAKKLAAIAALLGEVVQYSAFNAEATIQTAMDDAAARQLDAAVFSNAAADASRPAGLLYGVTPMAATALDSSGGSFVHAMARDVANLVGAIADAGGGQHVVIFAHPVQATMLQMFAEDGFATEVFPASILPHGTVVAVEIGALASGFNGLPQVDISKETLLHFEDTAPAAIGTAGSPNTVAAPVRSTFQQDMIALRLILRCAWATRLAGAVQMVSGVVW